MKKSILLAALSLTILNLVYCQSSEQVNSSINEEVAAVCPGARNFIIDSSKAKGMLKRFDTIYVRKHSSSPITILGQAGWIDSTVFQSIAELLSSDTTYDGLIIAFGAYDVPFFRKKMSMVLIPTSKEGTSHKLIFESVLRQPRSSSRLNVDINLSRAKFHKRAKKFFTRYRHQTNVDGPDSSGIDSLSRSVWLSSCSIGHINDYMKYAHSGGIRIYPAAYSKREPQVPGQKYDNQSTFIILPTKYTQNEQVDDWGVYPFFKDKTRGLAAFNHGELCPTKCPKGSPDNP
jgi:hypothetical protein